MLTSIFRSYSTVCLVDAVDGHFLPCGMARQACDTGAEAEAEAIRLADAACTS